jgi:SHS2 domain-containing protein
MSRNFEFIDHTADIAVKLEGSTFEELFTAGAEAWLASVIENKDLRANDRFKIELTSFSIEELLVSFINELNFLLNIKRWLCLNVDSIKIYEDSKKFKLTVSLNGIKVEDDFELKEEIKSVTYHQIEIKKDNALYSTRVVFDI